MGSEGGVGVDSGMGSEVCSGGVGVGVTVCSGGVGVGVGVCSGGVGVGAGVCSGGVGVGVGVCSGVGVGVGATFSLPPVFCPGTALCPSVFPACSLSTSVST